MEGLSPNEEIQKGNSTSSRWDISIVIAILALLISSLSAFISLKESRMMMKQQEMLVEQQEASVWPYLANLPMHQFNDDTTAFFQYLVENKGIGPAIIDDVIYSCGGSIINSWSLPLVLEKKFPSLNFTSQGNANLSGRVLAPGEKHVVITVKLNKSTGNTFRFSEALNQIDTLFNLEYCYCSVYGKCWKVNAWDDIKRSDECQFRKEIR